MFRIQGQDFTNLFDLHTCRSSIRQQQGEGSKGGLMKEKLLAQQRACWRVCLLMEV
jgi:hypothetical protein